MGGASQSGKCTNFDGELVSPAGRIFLQRELEVSIDCFVTFQNPVDIAAIKATLASSLVRSSPRLRSVLVTDGDGRLRWKELPYIDINTHVIVVPEKDGEVGEMHAGFSGDNGEERENDFYINKYLAALPSLAPLSRKIPLWEVHVLPQRRKSLVLRFHHALGDCVCLLGSLLSSCDPANEEAPIPVKTRALPSFAARIINGVAGVWRAVKKAHYTLPYVIDYCTLATHRNEDITMFTRGKVLAHSPRKLASITLNLDDMKAVKNKLNATINDIFVGIISCGIEKYLEIKTSNEISEDAAMTGLVVVNIRGEGPKDFERLIREGKNIKWGNKLGYFVLPINLKKKSGDLLDYVREAKTVLDRKKLSFEARFTNKINVLVMSIFGQKTMASINSRFHRNISLLLSNIVGPSEPITSANNLVTKMGVTLSSLPAALDVHMISYDGKAFLQVLVAEEIIPDPEMLCNCVARALSEMKAEL